MSKDIENLFSDKVLGHPAGLFVLFFTEMWERFSFYGMRILLVNFLTMPLIGYNPGWEWSAENAAALFGTYAMLLYITPILGGIIADKLTGYRWAVVIGALIMTFGHVSMALETEFSLYTGLALLVIGTGFFKPNITSIISEMYKKNPEKKDGAYTIFYMGVNAGAFFGMMLCGYLAEKVGWAYGFGLAGIFMLLGTLQFWFSGKLFGSIGDIPKSIISVESENKPVNDEKEPMNKFTKFDKILIVISSLVGLGYAFNDPLSKIGGIDMFSPLKIGELDGQYSAVLFIALPALLVLTVSRIMRYTKIIRDRMFAFIIFAFFTVFFWMSFEQGATSLVLFARDNVDRALSGNEAIIFNIINALLTIIPLAIITYVLILLWKRTHKKIFGSNIVLIICFAFMWFLVGWTINRDFNTVAYDINYKAVRTNIIPSSYNLSALTKSELKSRLLKGQFLINDFSNKNNLDKIEKSIKIDSIVYKNHIIRNDGFEDSNSEKNTILKDKYLKSILAIDDTYSADVFFVHKDKVRNISLAELYYYTPIYEGSYLSGLENIVNKKISIAEPVDFKIGQEINIIAKNKNQSEYGYLDNDRLKSIRQNCLKLNKDSKIILAKVTEIKENEVEITVAWFSILNSFFIILFASFFSRWWESKYNPSATAKYALGLIIMAIGFGLLAFGSYGISEGVKVSMLWLILAYLFHTLGELCLSPVGLSYVSKLVPGRMIAFMFGMWYLAIAIGNKLAAVIGGQIENITKEYNLSTFFLIFTIVPIVAGLVILALNPLIKRLMHGIR